MDDKLRAVLDEYPGFEVNRTGTKIYCTWSAHEMPCQLEALQSYVSGKKYQRLREKNSSDLLDKYSAHLMPSTKRGHERQLFCKLTLRHLNRLPHHIERHVMGRRFTKALARWEECQSTGTVYQPRYKMKRIRNDSIGSNSSVGKRMTSMKLDEEESDGVESDDSMSDLFPAKEFTQEEPQEDDMETDMTPDDPQSPEKEVMPSKPKSNGENSFAEKRVSKNKQPKSLKHKSKKMKT